MSGDPLAATPKKPTIIFLGDSITTGQYVNQVKEMIPGCTVHRYAKSGYTSEQVKREFLESAIAKNPTVMVIMVGANDIWQGKTLESVVKNIGAMVSVANKKEIPVILVTIPPMRKYLEGENPKEGFDEYVEKNIDRGMDIDSLVDILFNIFVKSFFWIFTFQVLSHRWYCYQNYRNFFFICD